MPNFWNSPADAVDLASRRHAQRSNYTFVDGHAAARDLNRVYDPAHHPDFRNPAKAQ